MDLEKLALKQNEDLKKFCWEEIGKIENTERFNQALLNGNFRFKNLEDINKSLGTCKVHKEYFLYFLSLLNKERKEIEQRMKNRKFYEEISFLKG